EVQQQMAPHSLLLHSPYDMPIKQEPGTHSPDHSGATSAEMLFASQFSLPGAFMHNNNSESMNHNSLGRSSCTTKDRKRPYPCNICPSRFGSKMELEEHQNSHTGQKPFECDVCKARFNRRSTLWNHKRIHSDAKPFVCSVCQMTFKWKNSLKCHKEMHLRKNESSTVLDNDLRQLTYATAAKRNKEATLPDSNSPIHPQPVSSKKKASKSSSASTSSISSTIGTGLLQDGSPNLLGVLPTAHIDIDQASLDTLVHQNNGNILVQLCSEVDPHLGRTNLLEDSLLSQSHLFGDIKNEIYPQISDSGLGMNGSISCQPINHINVNVQIPIGNMFNFRGIGQSLPSVHHLTSTASSLPSVSIPTDYTGDLSQSQYILSHNDMMPSVSYQQNMDPCLILSGGGTDYMSNYDFSVIGVHHGYDTNASTPGDSHSSVPSVGLDSGVSGVFDNGKSIPHDRW
ncbi:hypothetical protein PFISCL1PPCAC_24900, partial [Pristionchus fissidentatus]